MKYSVWSIFRFKRKGWTNKWKQELEEVYNEELEEVYNERGTYVSKDR